MMHIHSQRALFYFSIYLFGKLLDKHWRTTGNETLATKTDKARGDKTSKIEKSKVRNYDYDAEDESEDPEGKFDSSSFLSVQK